jgi:hypothetical protein
MARGNNREEKTKLGKGKWEIKIVKNIKISKKTHLKIHQRMRLTWVLSREKAKYKWDKLVRRRVRKK